MKTESALLGLSHYPRVRLLTARYFLSLGFASLFAVLGTVLVERYGQPRGGLVPHFTLLISVLGIWALQGMFVVRPAAVKIQQHIRALEVANHNLQHKATFVGLLQVVAVAANEATSVEAAFQFALDRICRHTGWPIGHVYFCEPKELAANKLWHFDKPEESELFREITSKSPHIVGVGLQSHAPAIGKPVRTPGMIQDGRLSQKPLPTERGFKRAFGFPVIAKGRLVAVMEFLSTGTEQPDPELLAVMSHVGAQLGQLMERKRAEQELGERAEELSRSNHELETFAYVASHDLQEPLRMIASYTQLLARRYQGKLDADADEFIGFAVDGANRMQQLIQDLLAYSRVTTQGKTLELVESQKACDDALANLRRSIEDCDAVVKVENLPPVFGDATQLSQLFQNLIGNALKYRNGSKPEVHVAARPEPNEWVFSVRDSGIGIEPQYFERIFQMFQRLHSRKQYSGTGIGLAVCKKIVERHGGRIWVESKPGAGSTFLFTIPQVEKV